MGIILWIVLGLIAGWIASVIMKTDSTQGPVTDIVLGVVGAVVGGFVLNLLGHNGVTGFNIYSIFVSTLGAIVVIWLGRMLLARR